MKINKFLKMLVLSAVVVSSFSYSTLPAQALPPNYISWQQAQVDKDGHRHNELGTVIMSSRNPETGQSLEINPKTNLQATRLTDNSGKPKTGMQSVDNGVSWMMYDENGFSEADGYLLKDGKIYRTSKYQNILACDNQLSNGRYFWAITDSANSAPYCATNQWQSLGNNKWIYLGSDGLSVVNNWIKSGNDWYYLGADSIMVRNTYVGNYQIGADGKWIQ